MLLNKGVRYEYICKRYFIIYSSSNNLDSCLHSLTSKNVEIIMSFLDFTSKFRHLRRNMFELCQIVFALVTPSFVIIKFKN